MKDIELTAELAKRLKMDEDDVNTLLAVLGEIMGEKLANSDVLSIHGLGQFEAKKKAERISVNPTNGKRYLVPPKLVPVFKPVTPLKAYLKTLDNNE